KQQRDAHHRRQHAARFNARCFSTCICSSNVAHTSPIVKLLNKDVMKRTATESPCRSAESGKQTCPPVPSPFAAQDGAIPARRPAVRCNTRRARGPHGSAQNRRRRK